MLALASPPFHCSAGRPQAGGELRRNNAVRDGSRHARFPGESWGPPLGSTSGGDMGPGFRRDSGPFTVSCLAGRRSRRGTKKKQRCWRRQPTRTLPRRKPGLPVEAAIWVPAFAETAARSRFHAPRVGEAGGGIIGRSARRSFRRQT
jgi:hypothetical protein